TAGSRAPRHSRARDLRGRAPAEQRELAREERCCGGARRGRDRAAAGTYRRAAERPGTPAVDAGGRAEAGSARRRIGDREAGQGRGGAMTTLPHSVHLIGIGGMHMSAIGQLLLERGVRVTGSDLRPSKFTRDLEARGARVFEGHAAENVGDAELVVTTAAASDDNPEIAEAQRRGIPVILRAAMVGRLIAATRVIAVAGAHGKTTTSSLIAFVLREAGRDPMYLLGGESIDLGGHAAWGDGDLCVVEADEYKRAFHEYTPEVAVITNVEPDHLDYYGTAEAYHEAFVEFTRKVKPGGVLLTCWDDAGARAVAEAVEDAGIREESYGIEGTRFWQATDIETGPGGVSFTLRRGGTPMGTLRFGIPGDHFVRNATAAAAACLDLGI